ncbi:Lipid A export ATP-binding/permease protein MsbA [Planctomycetales bacterium 10988]|nr:Lipid A export ATP-binding/permease protein MsbA [Planctomycetales bacterium 10988]
MNNLNRALKLMLRYRVRTFLLFLSAVMVGVFWGINISLIYPLIEIVFNPQAQNPREWATTHLTEMADHIGEVRVQLDVEEARTFKDPSKQILFLEETETSLNEILHPEENSKESKWQKWLAKAKQDGLQSITFEESLGEISLVEDQWEAEVSLYHWIVYCKPAISYLPNDRLTIMIWIVVGLFILTMVKSFFFVVHALLSERLVQDSTLEIRSQLYKHALQLDQGAYHENGTADIMSRFTFDLDSLSLGLKTITCALTREPLKMFVCLAMAAWICWPLLIFSMLVVPIGGLLVRRLSRLLKNSSRKAMEEMSRLYTRLDETFKGIRVVQAYTMESHEEDRFRKVNQEYLAKTMRIARYSALTSPVTESVGIASVGITLLLGAYLVISQETHILGIPITDRPLGLGTLLTFYGLLAGTSEPMRKLSNLYNRVQRGAAAADRIYALLDTPPALTEVENPKELPLHQREIEFKNVSFSYDQKVPTLQNIDLTIRHGETVAIIGSNGCGKSTLLQMLPRFLDPKSGQVLIDGVDIKQCRFYDLRKQIGFVPQKPVLFQDTIFANIAYGKLDATEEEILAAAEKAHVTDFVEEKLQDGFHTVLAEGGSSLSGGQAQRIALARAILRNPPILLLDEATSQIDPESERLLHRALQEFSVGRTTIFITHRMSALDLADRIVVMGSGKILDIGTHEQLLARCEVYRNLYEGDLKEIA